MDYPPVPLWFYEGSGVLWTPEGVPKVSVQVPAGPFPPTSATETTENDYYHPHDFFLPPYEQDLGYAATDCGAFSASSHDSIRCTPAFPPSYIIPPPSILEHGSLGQQTLTHVVQPDSYDTHFYAPLHEAESTTTTSSSWTAVTDHSDAANLVAPWESDVASGYIDHHIFYTSADGLGSRHRNHATSFPHAFTPTSAVVPNPLGSAITTTSRSGSGCTAINHHGGEESRAATSESSSSAALTAGQHPWSNPFLTPEATSSITATPVRTTASGPYAVVDERRSHGSKVRQPLHQEIVQQDYGKSNRRISYGPNGVSLEEALRGVVGGHSDRIAFEGVEMSQKMSVRYQFKKYRVHKPQVNVLSCARRKLKQPTYRRLAIIAAKEMQRFMDKARLPRCRTNMLSAEAHTEQELPVQMARPRPTPHR
ncbi:hypothetical protein K466DRAFT_660164, partial [Polyporus arcularius HHB13444]